VSKTFFFFLASTERNFHTKNAIAIAKVREKNVVAKLKRIAKFNYSRNYLFPFCLRILVLYLSKLKKIEF
jgi:hypothetical protein